MTCRTEAASQRLQLCKVGQYTPLPQHAAMICFTTDAPTAGDSGGCDCYDCPRVGSAHSVSLGFDAKLVLLLSLIIAERFQCSSWSSNTHVNYI